MKLKLTIIEVTGRIMDLNLDVSLINLGIHLFSFEKTVLK